MTHPETIRPDIHKPEDVFGVYDHRLPAADADFYEASFASDIPEVETFDVVFGAFEETRKQLSAVRESQLEIRRKSAELAKSIGSTLVPHETSGETEEQLSLLDLVDLMTIRCHDILPEDFTASLADKLVHAASPEEAVEVGESTLEEIAESEQLKKLRETNELVSQRTTELRTDLNPKSEESASLKPKGLKQKIIELIRKRDIEWRENNFNFVNCTLEEDMQKNDPEYFALTIKEAARKYRDDQDRHLKVKYERKFNHQINRVEARLAGMIAPDKWIGKGYGAEMLDIWIDFIESEKLPFGLTSIISKPQIAKVLMEYGDREESKYKFIALKNKNGPDYTVKVLPVDYWDEDRKGHKIPKVIYTNPQGGPSVEIKDLGDDGRIRFQVSDLKSYSPEEQADILAKLAEKPDIPFHRQWKMVKKPKTVIAE